MLLRRIVNKLWCLALLELLLVPPPPSPKGFKVIANISHYLCCQADKKTRRLQKENNILSRTATKSSLIVECHFKSNKKKIEKCDFFF